MTKERPMKNIRQTAGIVFTALLAGATTVMVQAQDWVPSRFGADDRIGVTKFMFV